MTITAETPGPDVATVIDEIVARLASRFAPERIVLFGSRARGDPRPDSDVDLLVVMPDGTEETATADAMLEMLDDLPFEQDIVVTTPEVIAEYGHSLASVLRPALREGAVLHERDPASPALGAALRVRAERMAAMNAETPDHIAEALHKMRLAAGHRYHAPSFLEGPLPMPGMTCASYQQLAEHALKAARTLARMSVPTTHNLRVLQEGLPPSWGIDFPSDDLKWLTAWNSKGRYPVRDSDEARQSVRDAGDLAKAIHDKVAEEFARQGIDLDFGDAEPAMPSEPEGPSL